MIDLMVAGPRGHGAWVGIGAAVGVLAGLGWAYFGSGPGRYEWVDIAIVMGPFGLMFGALGGAIVGHFRRVENDGSEM